MNARGEIRFVGVFEIQILICEGRGRGRGRGRAKGPFEKSAPWNPQNLSDKRIKHRRDELQILIYRGVMSDELGVAKRYEFASQTL
jgi:hypothetical protein